jgi:EAL domain-containing protein (putative c-di-GMP-specific phosphodiesterase class I)
MSAERRVQWTNTSLVAPGADSVRVIRRNDVRVVLQPIVDLRSGRLYAYEALTRCALPQFANPAQLFERAAGEEACGRLGRMVRDVLFEQCAGLPVFINVHPQELRQRWLVQPTDPLFTHDTQVYIEVTESAAIDHFDICMSVLHELRARGGVKIVVDDFGAGYSDLDRVLALQPDIVKLDMSLIRNINMMPEVQTRVAELIKTCHQLKARVVCEGIETAEELVTVIQLDADLGQGYLLGRPDLPAPLVNWPL